MTDLLLPLFLILATGALVAGYLVVIVGLLIWTRRRRRRRARDGDSLVDLLRRRKVID